MFRTLVVNASPLIFLGNADRLDLLKSTGARIVVPEAVYDEVASSTHADTAARSLAKTNWIERQSSVSIPASIVEWDLGPGESAVVAVTLTAINATAVIDDLSGRKCALAHKIEVIGTLGIVIAAHRRGQIDDPR